MQPSRLLLAPLPCLFLASSAMAHDIETHVPSDGLEALGPAIVRSAPSSISLTNGRIELFECNGPNAAIDISDSNIELAISSLDVSQPQAGVLRVDMVFSASSTGSVDFERVIFCGSEFTCQSEIAFSNVGATVVFSESTSANGELGLEVAGVEIDLDAERFDFALSDCAYAEQVNTVIDLVDTLGVSLLANLAEDFARESLAPAIESAALGISNRNIDLALWDLSVELREIDLSDGMRIVASADLSSAHELASCLASSDPGEPPSRQGMPPTLAALSDLNLHLNLGLIDDLLYQAWTSAAQCPSLEVEGSFVGDYLTGLPSNTEWSLQATVHAPPRIEGLDSNSASMQIVMEDIELELVAEHPARPTTRILATLDARADAELMIDNANSSLRLSFRAPRVTRLLVEGEATLAEQGFDAAQLSQYLSEVYLPEQLESFVASKVALPLGLGIGDVHVIVKELRSNPSYLSIGLDLFAAPSNDTTAPDTSIAYAPSYLVSAQDALVVASGSDSQVPSQLLRYQYTIDGIEMPLSSIGELQIGRVGRSGSHRVEVRAVDLAGNVDPTPEVVRVDVDGIRPTLELSATASGDTVDIEFSASDDRTMAEDLVARVVIIDAETGVELRDELAGRGTSRIQIEALDPAKSYRLTVVVYDEAGNEGVKSIVLAPAALGGCSAGGSSGLATAFLILAALLAWSRKRGVLLAQAALLVASCSAADDELIGQSEAVEVPQCASELARDIWQGMLPVANRGTISMKSALGTATRVDPQLYIDGPEIFTKWADLIEGAEKEVAMQFYKWEPETDATETILGGLRALQERRKAAGATTTIPVSIIIDTSVLGVAAPITEDHMPWVMERIEAYELEERYVDLTFAVAERGLLDQFGNLHVKTMVVDGEVAIITGANPEYQHNFDQPWHDLATVFYGDIVQGVLDDIDYTWQNAQTWICPSSFSDREMCLIPAEMPVHVVPQASRNSDANACAVMGLTRAPSVVSNNEIDNPQDQAFLAAFENAERVIKIETPNINDDAVKDAIWNAIERGVEVRIITSKEFNEVAEGFVGGPNGQNIDEFYRELALRGHEDACRKLQIRWYSQDGQEPIVGNGAYASHTKYSSFDDQVVIVGTTNMDTASWNFSHELNLAIDDADLASQLDSQLFDADWERAIVVDVCAD